MHARTIRRRGGLRASVERSFVGPSAKNFNECSIIEYSLIWLVKELLLRAA
jgi:hypothetical protein